jgi:hypothetical protein
MTPAAAALRLDTPPPGFFDDPYPWYRAAREQGGVLPDGMGGFLVTRHALLSDVYRDAARFASDKTREFLPKFGPSPLYDHHTTSLVFNDEPYHGRVRRRLVGALSPRAVAALGERLASHCGGLLDRLADKGEADLVEHYAAAIPVRVIGDLLGVPEDDRAALRDWSLAILGALEPVLTDERKAAGNAAVRDFSAYLERLIEDRRRHPGDPQTDLLTRLIEGEPPLTGAELVHNAIFLLNAGHETTTNLIGSALNLLIADPSCWPDDAPIEDFVEEVLRFESPNQLGNRRTVDEAVLDGIQLPAGSTLTLLIGDANRDPAAFEHPDRFDARRRPNRHLAFGAGIHQCAGLSLARLEAAVALETWRRRVAAAERIGPAKWQHRIRFRGLAALPATLRMR